MNESFEIPKLEINSKNTRNYLHVRHYLSIPTGWITELIPQAKNGNVPSSSDLPLQYDFFINTNHNCNIIRKLNGCKKVLRMGYWKASSSALSIPTIHWIHCYLALIWAAAPGGSIPCTTDMFTPAFSNTCPSCIILVIPPPPWKIRSHSCVHFTLILLVIQFPLQWKSTQ